MAYTDMERRILDMWPKYEDGSYVQLGDSYVDCCGGDDEVSVVGIFKSHAYLIGIKGSSMRIKPNGRLKRPAPKVLDADGVEIKVGDRVYSIETGNSYIVRSVNCSGTIEFEGSECKGWSSKRFTHTQPAIDADGVLIKIGDTVWHEDGSEQLVEELNRYGVRCFDGAKRRTFSPTFLTHTSPESWERLEKDALKGVCEYAGAERKPGTIDAHTCCGFRFDEDGDGPTCEKQMALDIIRRAKALAEKEAAR